MALGSGGAGQDKIASYLRDRLDQIRSAAAGSAPASADRWIRSNSAGQVQVYVHPSPSCPDLGALADRLAKIGGRDVRPCAPLRVAQAWLSPEQITVVAGWSSVCHVGLPGYGFTRAGSVLSEGDAALKAALARGRWGVSGAGVKVGVISDDVDHLDEAQATGDLPAGVFIGKRDPTSGDEGTAMLEIIHDLAPGAELGFSAGLTTADFINSIAELKDNFGADVIVDDIGFFTEPFYEDGPVAQAAQAAVDGGVCFVSAVGNESLQHYEARFRSAGARPGALAGWAHDFDAGPAEDAYMNLGPVQPGERLQITLQWAEPFQSPASNYKLHLYLETDDPAPTATSQNLRAMLGGGYDYAGEELDYTNSGAETRNLLLVVERRNGAAAVQFEIFGLPETHQYPVRESSVFGHPGMPGVIAAAAAWWSDSAAIEDYSQVGPAEIFFPAYATRPKPDVTGVDGVSVTGAGGFSSPFFGTSAAAPHVAAVAALALEAEPGFTPVQIHDLMQATAANMLSTGFDYYSGWGLVDADNMMRNLPWVSGARIPWMMLE